MQGKQNLYAAFVDLGKVFDTLNRTQLWKVLRKLGCPARFLTIPAALHEHMNAVVVAEGNTSDPSTVSVGVKQGCLLAPVLFTLFTATVTKMFYANNNTENGVSISCRLQGNFFSLVLLRARRRIFTKTVIEFQHADDAALVSHTEHRLQNILDFVSECGSRMELKTNTQEKRHNSPTIGTSSTEQRVPMHLCRAEAPISGPPFYLLGFHPNI